MKRRRQTETKRQEYRNKRLRSPNAQLRSVEVSLSFNCLLSRSQRSTTVTKLANGKDRSIYKPQVVLPSFQRSRYLSFLSDVWPLSLQQTPMLTKERQISPELPLSIASAHPTLSVSHSFRRCIDPKCISEGFVPTIKDMLWLRAVGWVCLAASKTSNSPFVL